MEINETARLDFLAPVRKERTSRRALTGRLSMANSDRVGFESSLERDWLICLDFDPDVVVIREQPFSLYYEVDGRQLRYTPDVLVQFRLPDGRLRTEVHEVKPLEDLKEDFQLFRPRFKKAIRFCREQGWHFKICTEKHIRTPYLTNAKFLRKYRGMSTQELYRDQLIYSMRALGPTTPQALLALAYTYHEKRMAALTELWRMVANREICVDLTSPLNMHSRIWLGAVNE